MKEPLGVTHSGRMDAARDSEIGAASIRTEAEQDDEAILLVLTVLTVCCSCTSKIEEGLGVVLQANPAVTSLRSTAVQVQIQNIVQDNCLWAAV